jgi:hypothetical protein
LGEVVIRKDAFLFAGQTRRWWLAPARFSVATLQRLRRAAARQPLVESAWLCHAPAGIQTQVGTQ